MAPLFFPSEEEWEEGDICHHGSQNVAMLTKMSIMPRWLVEETNTKYALPSLGMTWDSDPTLTD